MHRAAFKALVPKLKGSDEMHTLVKDCLQNTLLTMSTISAIIHIKKGASTKAAQDSFAAKLAAKGCSVSNLPKSVQSALADLARESTD